MISPPNDYQGNKTSAYSHYNHYSYYSYYSLYSLYNPSPSRFFSCCISSCWRL